MHEPTDAEILKEAERRVQAHIAGKSDMYLVGELLSAWVVASLPEYEAGANAMRAADDAALGKLMREKWLRVLREEMHNEAYADMCAENYQREVTA